MMINAWWLLPAAWIGAGLAFVIFALCAVAKKADKHIEPDLPTSPHLPRIKRGYKP